MRPERWWFGMMSLFVLPAFGQGQIEQWTEADGVLGLGYPVPIPVDTALPFDGFRSYPGLHSRHQDLAAESEVVQGFVVGETHNLREVWAYRIGDADLLTRDGLPEPAMLTNGGIHAREWQTPEVVTGIMELLVENRGDRHFYDYLLDNTNVVLIPVLNVDGFLQTQRFPTENWLGSDPFDPPADPVPSPRDGRMRRKNMPGVDEDLVTAVDHLLGVDLNRNSPPFWSTNPNRSSDDNRSLVHHGAAPQSEPEIQALLGAAELGPVDQLRAYTDIHSFSRVFYYARSSDLRLTQNTIGVLTTMSNHNAALPNGALYLFSTDPNASVDQGIGLSNEYFTHALGIPSWGIEVEPSQGQSFFPDNPPGCGADYGGLARNCHDGFILPESQIRRVRNELSRTMAAAYYQQSGPPSVAAFRVVDEATQAVVFEAEWDPVDDRQRSLYTHQVQPLAADRDYRLWLAFDRPMRWREQGAISPFPGQPVGTLDLDWSIQFPGGTLGIDGFGPEWLDSPAEAPNGFFRYEDDAVAASVQVAGDQLGGASTAVATLRVDTTNLTGQSLDADPATPVIWADGGWSGYEDSAGQDGGDVGGTDATVQFEVSRDSQPDPFVVEPGTTAAWFDPTHTGEGFIIEILADGVVVMYWFTYDEAGEQAWYIATGEVRGNRLLFPEVIRTAGGVFGPDFDPDTVVRTVVGSARFLYESCGSGTMVYDIDGRKGRFELERLSRVMGADCGEFLGPPVREEAVQSGAWFNADQSGHGFTIEILADGAVLVYWFTYDLEGRQAWFFGTGDIQGDELVISDALRTRGPVFGAGFDPNDLALEPWGSLRFQLGCETGTVSYDGTPGGFPAANLALDRLTAISGLACGSP